jgi:hypothetical protein
LLLLLSACVAVYYPVFENNFQYGWDDQIMVLNHYTTGGWSMSNLWNILTDFPYSQYSPLLELNYLLIYTIGKYNPLLFHAAGLLWHIGNVLLVWTLIKKVGQIGNTKMTAQQWKMTAFLTALLFAVHPVNVEAVAWLSAHKVIMYAFFSLLGFLCYIKYIENKRIRYFVATIICFTLSFMSKEQAVIFPVAILLIDWFARRDLKSRDVWEEKVVFFAIAIFFFVVTLLANGNRSDSSISYPLGQRMVFAGYGIFEYITKSLFPIKLNFLYPFPMVAGEALPVKYFIYPILIALLAGCVYVWRQNRLFLFWVMFFIINLLTCLHLFTMNRMGIVADRYLYVSIVSIMFALSYGLVKVLTLWTYFIHSFNLFNNDKKIFYFCRSCNITPWYWSQSPKRNG